MPPKKAPRGKKYESILTIGNTLNAVMDITNRAAKRSVSVNKIIY